MPESGTRPAVLSIETCAFLIVLRIECAESTCTMVERIRAYDFFRVSCTYRQEHKRGKGRGFLLHFKQCNHSKRTTMDGLGAFFCVLGFCNSHGFKCSQRRQHRSSCPDGQKSVVLCDNLHLQVLTMKKSIVRARKEKDRGKTVGE